MKQETNGNGWASVGKVLGLCLIIIGVPTAFVWSEIFSKTKDIEMRMRVIEAEQVRLTERLKYIHGD